MNDSKKEAGEVEWLNAVKQTLNQRAKDNPPVISQSEIESLLIGLKGQETKPLVGKPLSPQGQKMVQILQGYLDIMKKKKKKFLPVKT